MTRNNNVCEKCGNHLKPNTKFCGRCGGQVINQPENKNKKLVSKKMLVTIFIIVIGLIAFLGKNKLLDGFSGNDNKAKSSTASGSYKSTVNKAEVDKSVEQVEAAFKSKNLTNVMKYIHPQMAKEYKSAFESHVNELDKIAILMNSRKPIAIYESYAEYEVTDSSGKYTMIFEKYNNSWVLTEF